MSTLRSPNNSGSFALQSSQQNLTVDFGYRGDSSLSGTVFNDPNDNKVLDPGESPRGGVKVHLLGADGKIIVTTTTNADGYYKFENLLAGTYSVRIVGINNGSVTSIPGSAGGTAADFEIQEIAVAASSNVIDNNFAIINVVSGLPNAGVKTFKNHNRFVYLAAASILATLLYALRRRNYNIIYRLG